MCVFVLMWGELTPLAGETEARTRNQGVAWIHNTCRGWGGCQGTKYVLWDVCYPCSALSLTQRVESMANQWHYLMKTGTLNQYKAEERWGEVCVYVVCVWERCAGEVCVCLCTILVMSAGLRRPLAGLVLRGFWVNDGRVSLLQYLLHQSICTAVILPIRTTLLPHWNTGTGNYLDKNMRKGTSKILSIVIKDHNCNTL